MVANRPIPIALECPEEVRVAQIPLRSIIDAAPRNEATQLARLRTSFSIGEDFDFFVAGMREFLVGDFASSGARFAQIVGAEWGVAAPIFRGLAMLGEGDPWGALELLNHVRDGLESGRERGAPDFRANRALVRAALNLLVAAEPRDAPPKALKISSPFCYLISYPRSGNSMVRNFLSFTFAAPRYSVYPGDGRYFSRYFHQTNPGHAVIVKDHNWSDLYSDDRTIALVRDGRNALISFARFLYVQGSTQLVRRGELAEFINHTASAAPFGFWGTHTRCLLDARTRGVEIRVVRYEDLVGNYARLRTLAEEIAGTTPLPPEDENGYEAFAALQKRVLADTWGQATSMPEESYIPPDWTVGGDTIRWQEIFDLPARRAFHELGGTEMLMELGYETDQNWWKNP